MELRVLKYFLTVANEENITRAAQILHITQPTLSRQLMQLERELGVTLFERGNHRISLTHSGMLFKRRAQELVELAEKAKQEFACSDELCGEISIGSGEFKSSQFLAELICSFRQLYPKVRFELYSGNSDNIKDQIERGLLDLGLLLEPVDLTRYDFLRTPVREEWIAYVAESSPLAGKEAISPEDLAEQSLILTRREVLQHQLRNWLGPYAERVSAAAQGNLLYNMVVLVRNGAGVAVNLRKDCHFDGVRELPLSPAFFSGTVLVWKKWSALSPLIEAFLQHARSAVKGRRAQE